MRDIKFRIWTGDKFDTATIEQLIYEDGNYYTYSGRNLGYDVQQFTGLLDKNGREVYEGDIVQTKEGVFKVKYGSGYYYYTHEIKCMGENWYQQLNPESIKNGEVEIIGNIYENKELLKEEK
jgi:hypothetical protein